MGSFSNGEINSDPASVKLHAVSAFLCLLGVLAVFKVDKGKASRPTRLLVIHDVDVTQRAIFRENLSQIPLSGVEAQSKHAQTVVGVWVGPVANVSASV